MSSPPSPISRSAPSPPINRSRPRPAGENVVHRTADEDVGPAAAKELVIARAAVQFGGRAIERPHVQDVIPLLAEEHESRERRHIGRLSAECSTGRENCDEAREMNIGFFARMQRGRPWVRMKVAASLDGKTALQNGQSQWITSQPARDDGHAWRARACAILTGIGTVKEDDPQLNVRAVETPRQPQRIVIDSHLEIRPEARVLAGGGTWIVAAHGNPEKEARLRAVGAEVILLPNAAGKVDLAALMLELGRRQINELHVEAGFKLNGSLIREGCVDKLLVYIAPTLLGAGMDMFALGPFARLDDKFNLRFHEVRQIGEDLRILARFNHH